MKAITIRQPYADAIVQPSPLPKRIENRGWPLPPRYIGVPVLLHSAATTYPAVGRLAIHDITGHDPDEQWPGVRGAILARITFTGCHFDGDAECDEQCATWGFEQVFHWRIADVTALPAPVPAKGALSFWTPAPGVLTAVQQQLGVPA
ncbi:hypothetical protein OG552_10285 [Streptomyces sp. NBC_01476]|uniref:hypothetical protein n=1 Tax=Streptomyces sp. NBC_01476 TaxID=2903881 RepID=UPI002E30E507|nr:hypothetical protein [Streptomyces sp. NBC_01476]